MTTSHTFVRQVGGSATVAVLATTMALTIPAATAADDSSESASCPALHVILAPGTSETSAWSDPNQDNHGYLSEVIKPVMAQANDGLSVTDPGGGFSDVLQQVTDEDTAGAASSAAESFTDSGDDPRISRTTLTYPATAGGAWASMVVPGAPLPKNFGDLTSYEQSVESGVLQAEAVMQDIIDSCDDTDIALLGYSQGAEVVSNITRSIGSGESSIPEDRIAAVSLFSDPTREGGTPALVNGEDTPLAPGNGALGAVEQTMTGLSDIDTPVASGLSPEKTGLDNHGTLSDRTVSWCLPGDYVCGLPAESELATQIAGLLEQISLEDPVEALQLLAESMDSAVKISDFQQVADIDFGEDGFKTVGLTSGEDTETSSVLAERVATTAETASVAGQGSGSADSPGEAVGSSDSRAGQFGTTDTEDDTDSGETLPEVEDGEQADGELPGTLNDDTTDTTETPTDTATSGETETSETSAASDSETPSSESDAITSTSADQSASSSSTAAETTEPAPSDSETDPAPAETDAEPQVDPLSSPQAFADAAIPAAARLGGMALGTAATVVKDTVTPQNVAQIGIAGVAGGPQAAATVATDKFIQSGMKLLEPGMASGKAREVLTIVEDSGFEVPEIMKMAVELSAWLSVNAHVQYGERALMPDGRSAEKATQDWLLAAAGDASGDTALTDDLLGDAVNFGVDVAREVAFDPEISGMATDALKEAMG